MTIDTSLEFPDSDFERLLVGYLRAHSEEGAENPYQSLVDLRDFAIGLVALWHGEPGSRIVDKLLAEAPKLKADLSKQSSENIGPALVAELNFILDQIDREPEDQDKEKLATFAYRSFLAGILDAALNPGILINALFSERFQSGSSVRSETALKIAEYRGWWHRVACEIWRDNGAPKFTTKEAATPFAQAIIHQINKRRPLNRAEMKNAELKAKYDKSKSLAEHISELSKAEAKLAEPIQVATVANRIVRYGCGKFTDSDLGITTNKAASKKITGETGVDVIGQAALLKALF